MKVSTLSGLGLGVIFMACGLCAACSSSSSGGGDGTAAGDSGADAGSIATHDSGASGGDAGGQTGSDASSGNDAGGKTGGDASIQSSTIRLKVPAGFTGTTRQLDVVVEAAIPPAGPPAGILAQMDSPTMKAGDTLTVNADTSGVSGDYYILAVVYMQGGGMFSPKPGIDYEASTMTKVHFDGSAHDLGELDLAIAK